MIFLKLNLISFASYYDLGGELVLGEDVYRYSENKGEYEPFYWAKDDKLFSGQVLEEVGKNLICYRVKRGNLTSEAAGNEKDGLIYYKEFKVFDGKLYAHGTSELYYENDGSEGSEKVRTRSEWSYNNQLSYERFSENGILLQEATFHKNRKRSDNVFSSVKKMTMYRLLDENKAFKSYEYNFNDDEAPHGNQIEFYPDGSVKKISKYVHGKLESGEPFFDGKFKDNKRMD